MATKKVIISPLILESLSTEKKFPKVPDIVYHGQPPKYENGKRIEPKIITKFNQNEKRFIGKNNFGFYFTDDQYIAERYAEGGNVYACHLNIKNPYYFEWLFNYNGNGLVKNVAFIKKEEMETVLSKGYDSIVQLNIADQIDQIVVFDPNKIEILKIIS